jgi:hypothetical protein
MTFCCAPRDGGPALAISVGTLLILLPWRAELIRSGNSTVTEPETASAATFSTLDRGRNLFIPGGLSDLNDAVLAAADGSWSDIYFGQDEMTIGARRFTHLFDFHLFPIPGGFMLLPLRSLPAGNAILSVTPGVKLDPSTPPIVARQHLSFGLPYWVQPTACLTEDLIPPPLLSIGTEVRFTGAENRYLAGGWSGQEQTGRWTDEPRAKLRFRVGEGDFGATRSLILIINGRAFIPPKTRPLDLVVRANGIIAGKWRADKFDWQDFSVVFSTSTLGSDRTVDVTMDMSDPRRPCDVLPGSVDTRNLGIFVRGIRLMLGSGTQ